jgi:hypothetical protein
MNRRMTFDCRQGDYPLDSSDTEHQRLIRQAMGLAPRQSFLTPVPQNDGKPRS